MEIEIDFSNINDFDTMHEYIKEKFGFPDFCGKNGNAYVDCLTSLRYPEDGMLGFFIQPDEVLNLTLKVFNTDKKLLKGFIEVIRAVNERYEAVGLTPPISLILV